MNTDALNEMADYLDRGEFGGREFSMGAYQDCVLGHCAVREIERAGCEATVEAIAFEVNGISDRVFGIKQSVSPDEWSFVFGAQWGKDYHAAADRLRYLARHNGTPDKSAWELYRTHPQPVVGTVGGIEQAQLAPSLELVQCH